MGDLLVIHDTGAHGFAMGYNYNGKLKSAEILLHEDGSFELKEFLPLSLTIDERIADGVYFANSIKVLKAFLMKPEYLLKPANEVIDTLMLREETGVN